MTQSNAFCPGGNAIAGEPIPRPTQAAKTPSSGSFGVPEDLLEFVEGRSVRDVCRVLRVSPNVVCALRNGKASSGQRDGAAAAWERYKARQLAAQGPTIKAIRRVYAGGIVHMGGRRYSHPQLLAHQGSVGICRGERGLMAVVFGEPNTFVPLQVVP